MVSKPILTTRYPDLSIGHRYVRRYTYYAINNCQYMKYCRWYRTGYRLTYNDLSFRSRLFKADYSLSSANGAKITIVDESLFIARPRTGKNNFEHQKHWFENKIHLCASVFSLFFSFKFTVFVRLTRFLGTYLCLKNNLSIHGYYSCTLYERVFYSILGGLK